MSKKDTCKEINQGILQRGIHIATIKYIKDLTTIKDEYISTNRSLVDMINFLKAGKINILTDLNKYYLKPSFDILKEELSIDIDDLYLFYYV